MQLRLATIARELGVEMRTIERTFFDEYRITMVEFQVEARLAYSKRLLGIFPYSKISTCLLYTSSGRRMLQRNI